MPIYTSRGERGCGSRPFSPKKMVRIEDSSWESHRFLGTRNQGPQGTWDKWLIDSPDFTQSLAKNWTWAILLSCYLMLFAHLGFLVSYGFLSFASSFDVLFHDPQRKNTLRSLVLTEAKTFQNASFSCKRRTWPSVICWLSGFLVGCMAYDWGSLVLKSATWKSM